MKKFFGGTFIKEDTLEEADIKHPIKLEYYKIINEDEKANGKNLKFGIEVIKTDYIEGRAKVEKKEIKYLSDDEQNVDDMLAILKANEVTPIAMQDTILEVSQQKIFSVVK